MWDIHNLVDIQSTDSMIDSKSNARELRFTMRTMRQANLQDLLRRKTTRVSGLDATQLRTQKTSHELVQEFVNFKPTKEYEQIQHKPVMMMSEYEL